MNRILHIQKVKGISGSERHLLALLPELQSRGSTIRMCAVVGQDGHRFVAAARDAGLHTTTVPSRRDMDVRLAWDLIREVRDFEPDLVHTHLIHADLYGQLAATISGIPGVSTVHGTHGFYQREPTRSVARIPGRLAQRTIAISEHVARTLQRNRIVGERRCRTVHYGIDVGRWSATPAERVEARANFGMSDDDVVVGMASRLVPHKGHDIALDAMQQAIRSIPGLRLMIAGEGPLRTELEARARHLPSGVVRFLGFVEDIDRFMTACDVFLFPSQEAFGEGFGLAALEAMAAGRPVVASAVASLPEIVTPEETGILVPPQDVDEFVSALVLLAGDAELRWRLGDRARTRAEQAFGLDAMIDGTLAVYDEVLRSDPVRRSRLPGAP